MTTFARLGFCVLIFVPFITDCGGHVQFFHSEKDVVFSDPKAPDHFTLTAFGTDTLDALVLFTIRSGNAVEIYRDSLTSVSFCGTGVDTDFPDDPSLLPAPRRQRMMAGLNGFLADSNFVRPAVRAGAGIDGICTDSLAWLEFRQDSMVTSFGYNRYLDLRIGIAYSKSRGKVVPFTSEP